MFCSFPFLSILGLLLASLGLRGPKDFEIECDSIFACFPLLFDNENALLSLFLVVFEIDLRIHCCLFFHTFLTLNSTFASLSNDF